MTEEKTDIAPGDILARAENWPEVSGRFAVHLIWIHDDALISGGHYLFKFGDRSVLVRVADIKHEIQVNSLQHLAAAEVRQNGIAVINLSLHEPIAFDPYSHLAATGGFIVNDLLANSRSVQE